MTPLFNLIESLFTTASNLPPTDAKALISRIVNGPIVGLMVKLSPNTLDDALLAMLKAAFPKT